ncbi:YceI family protein [Belliella sp. DSM 111904]|uniref:YceI family protein n=1 Tax=Belliella filtrata TaxID=2923435 RepID=A0ABS9V0J5_9BACT|nr:YceI family protein [Belliella filtrata]MCH7409538.1 YceI family protein [Belliella filtrata]
MKLFTTLSLAIGIMGSLFLSNPIEDLTVNKSESTVDWKAAKVTGEHYGKVSIADAKLDYENGKILGGSFEIDMTTITVEDIKDANSNKRLLDHLKSDDFFSVEKHKKSTLKITEAKSSNGKDYEIKGDLTIKGISHPVVFPVKVSEEGNRVIASGTIKFDRTMYDIKYRSGNYFENLADKVIYDEVTLDVRLVGVK